MTQNIWYNCKINKFAHIYLCSCNEMYIWRNLILFKLYLFIPPHASSDPESLNPSQSSGITTLIIYISTWYYFVTAFFYLLQLCSSQGGVQCSKYVWCLLNWNKLILALYDVTNLVGSFCRKVSNGLFILARGSILQVLECILTKITVRLHECILILKFIELHIEKVIITVV